MFELRLICPEDRVEPLSDALEALEALSVSVEDADADTDAERALFGEPGLPPPAQSWSRSRMVALFGDEAQARDAARLLALQDFWEGCEVASIAPVPEQDWVRLTQSQFEPVPITPSFWIVPTWHEVPAGATGTSMWHRARSAPSMNGRTASVRGEKSITPPLVADDTTGV